MALLMEKDNEFVANTYKRFPVEIVSGKGSIFTDINGKEYIDMGSGIGVNCFGAADDVWAEAVAKQAATLQHTSNLYYTAPCAELAELLCKKTGMKKVFFCNSGAEANECAIKTARKYAQDKKGEEYYTVITLVNSFHGRTVTTLAATGQETFHTMFTPLTEGFVYVPANDLDAVKKAIDENKCAAVMFECVQGEGGVMPLEKDYLQALAAYAAEKDVLLIADEVQTGNGRTGELYGYMNFGIVPDIVSTAKGLGGGLPIGACMFSEKTENVLSFGQHGSTFGGNPVCCAGALSVLKRMDEKFLAEIKAKSKYVFDALNGAKGVEAVSGMGLMIGITTTRPAAEIVSECIENGVLCLTAKTKVRLLPPLNIPQPLLEKAIEIIKSACAKEV
ncbi:MAG: acetylornithine/succinylornithine family transaminase [Clostridia bacterium]|nr:acetylornithine/succinylornithine family transaminase [Clostridia bacterium]MBR0326517.1 acetylornithine/succinylornithine family transaminase [Clostridia bacterium]